MSGAQLAHWLNDGTPWVAQFHSSDTTSASPHTDGDSNTHTQDTSQRDTRVLGSTAMYIENSVEVRIANNEATPPEWQKEMSETSTVIPYGDTMTAGSRASSTLMDGMQRAADWRDGEHYSSDDEGQELSVQDVGPVLTQNFLAPTVPPSILQEVCDAAAQSSYTLTDEKFQDFMRQPLHERKQAIQIFLQDMACRGFNNRLTAHTTRETD